MSEGVYLSGFGFTGFRSFSGPEVERIGPMSKVHLVAGPNNAGKSNVLSVAQRLLATAPRRGVPDLGTEDLPLGTDPREALFRLVIAYRLTDADRGVLNQAFSSNPPLLTTLQELFAAAGIQDADGLLWLEHVATSDGPDGFSAFGPSDGQTALLRQAAADVRGARPAQLAEMSQHLTGRFDRTDPLQNAFSILHALTSRLKLAAHLPPVATVSGFRRIGPGNNADPIQDGHDGPGLIERLAELQSPSGFDASKDQERFAAITRFVAMLFDDPAAQIQAANDRSTIFLTQNGRRLPLENYGTGVHEVVILAAAATVLSGHLVCIEEPEIHLHPTLQRRLLAYLSEKTDNQYLIATHSAHLLDAARASISAVRLADGRTQVAPAITPRDVADLSAELGLRASDLVQANAVIWVEGPSDRTYLRHWLSLIDDALVEGEHFSIMFYGGSLLSDLSPQDPSVDEFVSLPRINRNFSIVIDSDKRSDDAEVNATKARVRDAFEQEGVRGVVWVTAGYTIENYVPPAILAEAVAAVHPQATYEWAGEPFENPLGAERFTDRASGADKTTIARAVVERWPVGTDWPDDLEERVRALAATVRAVNDLPPHP